jgi:hypothetical protein
MVEVVGLHPIPTNYFLKLFSRGFYIILVHKKEWSEAARRAPATSSYSSAAGNPSPPPERASKRPLALVLTALHVDFCHCTAIGDCDYACRCKENDCMQWCSAGSRCNGQLALSVLPWGAANIILLFRTWLPMHLSSLFFIGCCSVLCLCLCRAIDRSASLLRSVRFTSRGLVQRDGEPWANHQADLRWTHEGTCPRSKFTS